MPPALSVPESVADVFVTAVAPVDVLTTGVAIL